MSSISHNGALYVGGSDYTVVLNSDGPYNIGGNTVTLVGPTGSTGPKGDTGSQGIQGPKGDAGGVSTLSALTDVGLTGLSTGQILKYRSSDSKWVNDAGKDSTEFYVSDDNGDDSKGNGSVLSPFKTIQAAINAAEALNPNNNSKVHCVIYVAPGSYSENLTITKGYIWITSNINTKQQVGVVNVLGDISIAITNASLNSDVQGRMVAFIGMLLQGCISNTSTQPHSVILQDCKVYSKTNGSGNTAGRCFWQSVSSDNRMRIINCDFGQNSNTNSPTNPMIEVCSGWLIMKDTDVASTYNCNLVKVGGDCYINQIAFCSFQNPVSGNNNLEPLVLVSSTSTTPANIAYNSFVYNDISAKSTTAGKNCSVRYTSSNSYVTLFYIGNVNMLYGTSSSNKIVSNGISGGNLSIYHFNNSSFTVNTSIEASAGNNPLTTTPNKAQLLSCS